MKILLKSFLLNFACNGQSIFVRRDQINCVRRNVGFVLCRFWQFADVTPVMTRKKLVQSLVSPHFLNCNVIHSRPSVEFKRRHNVAFNSCARYIFGFSRSRSISSYSAQILGVPLNTYFEFRRCSMMYHLISTRCPAYLSERLRMATAARTMNSIDPPFNIRRIDRRPSLLRVLTIGTMFRQL
jgi:hypothetical protein